MATPPPLTRVCIVRVRRTPAGASMLLKLLPRSILCIGEREAWDMAGWELKLAGLGLPDWCEVKGPDEFYHRATVVAVKAVEGETSEGAVSYARLEFIPCAGLSDLTPISEGEFRGLVNGVVGEAWKAERTDA